MSHRFITKSLLLAISAAAVTAAAIVGIVADAHSPQPSVPPGVKNVEVGDQASEDPASPSAPASNSPPGELYGVDADPNQLLEASRFC